MQAGGHSHSVEPALGYDRTQQCEVTGREDPEAPVEGRIDAGEFAKPGSRPESGK